MSRKFRVWLNSGANIHSCFEQEITLELGLDENIWDDITEAQQEEIMREVAWGRAGWGFEEITGENP